MDLEIEGSTALVTGAARGIGAAIAGELADQGLALVLADVDGDGLARTESRVRDAGVEALAIETDVADAASVDATVSAARERFDGVDVLVNNAGIAGPTAAVESIETEAWERTLGVNLGGPFLLCRAVLGEMKARGYGRIVNIASASGKRPVPRRAPYTASKAGLLGLTRTVAYEGGPHDVNANAICPGTVDGPRIDRVIDREADATGRSREAVAESWRRASPREEFVQAADVAALVAYLCSTAADRITGQSINVSAGKITY